MQRRSWICLLSMGFLVFGKCDSLAGEVTGQLAGQRPGWIISRPRVEELAASGDGEGSRVTIRASGSEPVRGNGVRGS